MHQGQLWIAKLQDMGFSLPDIKEVLHQWEQAGSATGASSAVSFTAGTDLDWPAQVLCIATPPAHRQLAALAAAGAIAATGCSSSGADEACVSDEMYFAEQAWSKVLGTQCIGCHNAQGAAKELRNMAPGQWQAEHFADLPVFVIPCYKRNLKHSPVGRPQIKVASFYGSVYPAVQNLLLGCRAVGLGASLQTLPIWWVPSARKILGLPRDIVPVCIIPIGWARGNYGPTTRRPIGEVVHLDRYGNQPFLER